MPETVTIKIKRHSQEALVPKTQTAGSIGFDLAATEEITIPAGEVAYVPLGWAMRVPEGYWLMLAPRSSLHKQGLMLINSIGIVDSDFSADENELVAIMRNFTSEEKVIKKGYRLLQGILIPKIVAKLEEVETLGAREARGKIGSTGLD